MVCACLQFLYMAGALCAILGSAEIVNSINIIISASEVSSVVHTCILYGHYYRRTVTLKLLFTEGEWNVKYFYVTTVQQNSTDSHVTGWKTMGYKYTQFVSTFLATKTKIHKRAKGKKSSNNSKTSLEGSKQRKKVQHKRSSLFHKTSQKFPVSNQQMALKACTVAPPSSRRPALSLHRCG